MEYYGNTLCISARELVDNGIMSIPNYKQLSARGRIDVVRRGGRSGYALVSVSSLPDSYREKVNALYPDPSLEVLYAWIEANYETDQAAVAYFSDWRNSCGHDFATDAHVAEYVANASVLNACIKLYNNAKAIHKTMGMKYDWNKMSQVVEGYRVKVGHTLPSSMLRFRKKVNEYQECGYSCLISGKFGNQSRRKVDHKTERLIISIASLPNKPYNTSVWEMYNAFVCGELEVYDVETGALFNPAEWTDKSGEPLSLSESTIANYLNKPKNRVLIEQSTTSYTTFMHEQMPHVHRHAPEFSFSKISFDDRDLPRKLSDSKARPKAYYAYDVTSQCVVGYAYNRQKNVDLVTDCFRSMFRLIERHGWGCPAQVEVENHLMSQWRESFLKAGVLFPFVRFCAPMNSQEKYAEPLNGAKKRSIEHKNHLGIGRFYAKSRAYRTESNKVFDAFNDTYEDKQYYTWDELIADDIRDIQEFNNSLHPNQKKYPGMTRWQVLEANMNPSLQPMDKSVWARFIGEHVETTIRRNSYCRVAYKDWWLSKTDVIERLYPNNWKVDAYYLTDESGEVTDVYIFQDDRLIDRLEDVGTYNTADAEQTDEDMTIFKEQQRKIAGFKGYISRNEIKRVGISKAEPMTEYKREEVELPSIDDDMISVEADNFDYASIALESL
ncbi:MAG: hypothetical protein SPI24_07550 [Bacteroidales bacterium]|nr:hypothetical protein [Bacteroidales bacterium]MDY6075564.1 hypothetical protein [Bacteroidales bacterium]